MIDFEKIARDHQKLSGQILDNIGIKINLSEIPENIEYMNYRYNAPWLGVQFRLIFKREKISQLLLNAQMAMLNKVLEQGDSNDTR